MRATWSDIGFAGVLIGALVVLASGVPFWAWLLEGAVLVLSGAMWTARRR